MASCIHWVVKKYYRHGSKSSFRANQPPTGAMIFESYGHEIRRHGTTSSYATTLIGAALNRVRLANY